MHLETELAAVKAKLATISANLDDPAFDLSKGRWDAPRDDLDVDVTSKLSMFLSPEEIAEMNANPNRPWQWNWEKITCSTRNIHWKPVDADTNLDPVWDLLDPNRHYRVENKYLVGHVKMHQYTYVGWLQVILALPNLYCLWRSCTAQVDAANAAAVTIKWLVDFTMNAYLISGGMEIVRGLMYLQHFSIYSTESPNEADAGALHLELVGFPETAKPTGKEDPLLGTVRVLRDTQAQPTEPPAPVVYGGGDTNNEPQASPLETMIHSYNQSSAAKKVPVFVTMNADASSAAKPEGTVSRMLGAVNPVFHFVGKCVNLYALLFYTRYLGYLNSPLATTFYVGNGLIAFYGVGSNLASGIVRMFCKLL